jgi:hypothetical protein
LHCEVIDEKPAGSNSYRKKNSSNTSKVSNGNKSKDNQSINEYLAKVPTIKNSSIRPKTS